MQACTPTASASMPNGGSSGTSAAVGIIPGVARHADGNDTGKQSEKEIWDFTVSMTAVEICVVGKFVNGEYGGRAKLNTVHMAMAGTPSLLLWQDHS